MWLLFAKFVPATAMLAKFSIVKFVLAQSTGGF